MFSQDAPPGVGAFNYINKRTTHTQVFKYRKRVVSPPYASANGVRLSPRSVAASGVGFILVIDRRLDRWAAVRATLLRIAVSVFLAMCLSQTPLIIAVRSAAEWPTCVLSISPVGVAAAVSCLCV